ncbi:MAG TPA: FCD domain-containing protein [Acidimicrobiia bacterium]|nr:FCD domain-containing protein [Acidimicrobiia bacterium]
MSMPTAAQLVAHDIRRRIVLGELADGESLPPEATLMAQYGISRPTFREALRILQSESLLTIRRGSRGGARVHAPNIEPVAHAAGLLLQHQGTTLEDVYEAMRIIEPPAAGLLARQSSRTARKALREALDDERAAADDPAKFAMASTLFHEAVIRLAGNRTLALFGGILHEILEAHSELVYRTETNPARRSQHSAAAHEGLVELVEARDAAAAEQHWRAHLDEIGAGRSRKQTLTRKVDLFRETR